MYCSPLPPHSTMVGHDYWRVRSVQFTSCSIKPEKELKSPQRKISHAPNRKLFFREKGKNRKDTVVTKKTGISRTNLIVKNKKKKLDD